MTTTAFVPEPWPEKIAQLLANHLPYGRYSTFTEAERLSSDLGAPGTDTTLADAINAAWLARIGARSSIGVDEVAAPGTGHDTRNRRTEKLMATTVLQLRMEALAQHLMEAQYLNTWLSSLQLNQKPDTNLWLKAVEAIEKEAEDMLADLQGAMGEDSPTEKIWNTYFHIYERSHEIFRESLELLGGLALRDSIQEEYACRFADELISECAELVGKTTSFAIPATEDTLSSTLRRVARVTFPDWHLWAVPLVAHEYGQVVVRESPALSRLVDELAQEASKPSFDKLYEGLRSRLESIGNSDLRTIAMDYLTRAEQEPGKAADEIESLARMLRVNETGIGELAQATASMIRDCLGEATDRARVLVADAFATFTAGPAYACATLMLRLNPNTPPLAGRPTDVERARTILAVLSEMDASEPQATTPFREVHKSLEASWRLLSEGSGSDDPSPSAEWPLNAAGALTKIKNRIRRGGYTKDAWIKAQKWSNDWWLAVCYGKMPEIPADAAALGDVRLRDVLNAAWHCRLKMIEELQPQDVKSATDEVADAARQLCHRILANRKPVTDPLYFGGPAPPPGEGRAE